MFLRFYHSSQPRLAVYGLGLTQIALYRVSLWVENLTDALLLCFQRLTQIQRDSTRFNKMIICGNLGWFVAEKSSQKNIRVICSIRGFRLRIQKTYKKFGIESKNLIIFSEFIPNLLPFCPPWAHTDRTGFLSLWVGNLTDALRWFTPKAHTDSTRINKKIICENLC